MARNSSIIVNALNVKTQPHSHAKYVELFQKVFSERIPVAIRGDQVAVVWTTKTINNNFGKDIITGIIYKFTHIDPFGDWFSTAKQSDASTEELEKIRIPDDLKHNLSQFRFVFLPEHHFLLFESDYYDINKKKRKSLSPRGAQRLFSERLCNSNIDFFKTCEVIIVQDKKELDEIFSLYKLTHLNISLSRPNPDSTTGFRAKILRRMEEQGIQRQDLSYAAMPGETIIPDDETKELANVALTDGNVTGAGKDANNKAVFKSTIDFPLTDSYPYDIKFHSPFDLLINKAIELIRKQK